MSLLSKIASLRQVNINAHAEIEALKEEVKARIWCDAQSNTEIEALKHQLADDDRSTLSTHEHHRELRDKLNAEIETLKLSLADRDEEVKSLKEDLDEPFARGASVEALKDEIKTLKDEVEKQTILAKSFFDTTEEYYEEKKELRCKQKTQATIISGMGKKITELSETTNGLKSLRGLLIDEIEALKDDAMKWRMLTAWEKATRGAEDGDDSIWDAFGEIEDDSGKINYDYFEEHYNLVRIGDTIQKAIAMLDVAETEEVCKKCGGEKVVVEGVCMGCDKLTSTYIYNTHNGNTIPCCMECSIELGVPHKVAETEE